MNAFNPMTKRQCALVRCDATGRNDGKSSLHGRCAACGATAYDWRRLVGVGARVAACSANPGSVLLTYPGACGNCGGSELVVAALATAADRRAGPLGSGAGDATPARGTCHA